MQPRKQEHEGFYELLVYKRLWLLVREGGFEPPYLGCWILSPRCLLTISYSCIIHAPKLMVQPLPYPSSARPGNSPFLFFNSLSLPKTKAPRKRGSVLDLTDNFHRRRPGRQITTAVPRSSGLLRQITQGLTICADPAWCLWNPYAGGDPQYNPIPCV